MSAWWQEPVVAPAATPEDIARTAFERETPLGQYLGVSVARAFEDTTPGLVIDALKGGRAARDAEGRLDPTHPAATFPLPTPDPGDRGLTQDQFKQIIGDRPIPFDPYATRTRAEALVELHDRRQWREWLIQQRNAGLLDGTAGFVAGMLGSLPDPINLVPLAGPAWRGAVAARAFGRSAAVAAGAGAGAAEGLIGTALVEPLIVARNAAIGDDTSFAEAMYDILLGGALGGVVGGAGAFFTPPRQAALPAADFARTSDAVTAPPRVRPSDLAVAGERVSLAVDDLIAGRAVDVGETRPAPDATRMAAEAPAEPVGAQFTRAGTQLPPGIERVSLPTGEPVLTRWEVVEAASLSAPERTTATSTQSASAALTTPEAIRGTAPIVDDAGRVEAGEIKIVDPETLAAAGFKAEGMQAPVLIRRRVPEEAAAARAASNGVAAAPLSDPTPGAPPPDPAAELQAALAGPEPADPIASAEKAAAGVAKQAEPKTSAQRTASGEQPKPAGEQGAAPAGKSMDAATAGEPDPAAQAALAEPDFPELAEYETALAEGKVAPEDRAAVRAATEELARVAGMQDAYRYAAACVLGALG